MDTETSRSLAEPQFDRSLIRWLMQRIGNPRISVRLWNGDEFPVTDAHPVACMEIRERRAVFELLRSPSLGFGESYMRGQIEIHGDLLAFSGAHLHRSVPNTSDRTRYSLDTRTIWIPDAIEGRGAANVDGQARWKNPGWFKQLDEGTPLHHLLGTEATWPTSR